MRRVRATPGSGPSSTSRRPSTGLRAYGCTPAWTTGTAADARPRPACPASSPAPRRSRCGGSAASSRLSTTTLTLSRTISTTTTTTPATGSKTSRFPSRSCICKHYSRRCEATLQRLAREQSAI